MSGVCSVRNNSKARPGSFWCFVYEHEILRIFAHMLLVWFLYSLTNYLTKSLNLTLLEKVLANNNFLTMNLYGLLVFQLLSPTKEY